jgi:GntR family transcriptional regulator of vanillate catabolism
MSPQLAPAASEAESHSQVIKAQLQLREMILAGELPAGERIAELTVVQRLGISRTPVRAALMRLEQEGLLEAMAGGRGYRVRLFSEADVADAIDRVLETPDWGDEAFSRYVALNSEFHDLLHSMAGSSVMQRELERVVRMPFASPSGFVLARAESPRARHSLMVAQDQHRQVLDAIAAREGARAEALMKEHSRIARRNLREAVSEPGSHAVPGVQLIRA